MATETRPSGWVKLVGDSLTMGANAKGLLKPPGARVIHFTTGTACTIQLCPRLRQAFTYIGTTYTDVTSSLTDRDTSTTLSMNDWATTSILYLGCDEQFRGFYVDVGNTNSNASVIDAEYWDGNSWEDLTETDNTANPGGTALGQDGDVTWTVPTDWDVTTVNNSASMYWVRVKYSLQLDASVTLRDMVLLNKESAAGSFASGVVHEIGLASKVAGIEAIEAGGATLTVAWFLD